MYKYVCTLHIMLCQLRVTFFARLKKYYLVYFRKKESNRTWVHILNNHRGSNFQDGKMLEGWNYVEMCVLKRCAALLYYLIFAKIQFGKLRIITSRKQQDLYIRILQMDRAPCYTSFNPYEPLLDTKNAFILNNDKKNLWTRQTKLFLSSDHSRQNFVKRSAIISGSCIMFASAFFYFYCPLSLMIPFLIVLFFFNFLVLCGAVMMPTGNLQQ